VGIAKTTNTGICVKANLLAMTHGARVGFMMGLESVKMELNSDGCFRLKKLPFRQLSRCSDLRYFIKKAVTVKA